MNFRTMRDNMIRELQTRPLVKPQLQPERDEIDQLESLAECWSECTAVHVGIFFRAQRYHHITTPTKAVYQAIRDFDQIRRQVCATN